MINNVANQIAFKILMLVPLYKENYKLPSRLWLLKVRGTIYE